MRTHLSKTISLLLVSVMLTGCNISVANDGAAGFAASIPHKITKESYPMYFDSADDKSEISLYFVDGKDIPYISMEESLDLLNKFNKDTKLYELTYKDNDHAVITRKGTKYDADFDFSKDTVTFLDYNAFLHMEGSPFIDLIDGEREAGMGDMVRIAYSNDRYGKIMDFDLGAYDIDMIKDNDGWYLPLQTFSDLFLSHNLYFALFNKECVIFAENVPDEELTDIYYSATGTVSEELAAFSYNELCFALDHLYGLKEIHDIDSFDEYLFEDGLKEALLETDPVTYDAALMKLIYCGFDDIHSDYMGHSYTTDINDLRKASPQNGPWGERFKKSVSAFKSARDEAFPDGVPPYQEIGNTAYITFDKFLPPDESIDYRSEPQEDELYDTVRLIQYSCDRIQRKDSPIANVVMDLSNNTGGYADAAAYVIAAFLGRGEINIKDTLTGATSTTQYFIDTNRDGEFDFNDTIAEKGYNLYCLSSPVSFSCGNLVPNVFKTSTYVTLIGQTSGGGSCSKLPLSTARGSMFMISSNYRLCTFKNGSFYDIDRGAEPDIYIAKIADFYDREALTEMINGIY